MVERSGASDDLTGHSDGLTQIGALGIPAENWPDFLAEGLDDAALQTMRRGERTGRPLGDADFCAASDSTQSSERTKVISH